MSVHFGREIVRSDVILRFNRVPYSPGKNVRIPANVINDNYHLRALRFLVMSVADTIPIMVLEDGEIVNLPTPDISDTPWLAWVANGVVAYFKGILNLYLSPGQWDIDIEVP